MAYLKKRLVFEGLSSKFYQFKNFTGTAFPNNKYATRGVGLGLTDPGSTISYGEFDYNGDLKPGGIYITGGDPNGVTALMQALEDDGWRISWAEDQDKNHLPYIPTKIRWDAEDSWLNTDVYKINDNGDAVEIPNALVAECLKDLQESRIEYGDFVLRPYNYEGDKQSAYIQEMQIKVATTRSPLASKRKVVKAGEADVTANMNIEGEDEELPFS